MTARAAATAAGKRAAAAQKRESKWTKVTAAATKPSGGTRRSLSPASPRRVSGPLRGRAIPAGARSSAAAPARSAPSTRARAAFAATATVMAAAVEVAPRIVHPAPRIARPLREAPRIDRPARRTAPPGATRGARALGFVRGLPDATLTDRLVRGRAWIPVLGVLLVGVVAMRVSLMQLNTSMGRAIEQGTVLQTENGELRAQVAELGNVSRIERIAGNLGMVMTTPGQISFRSAKGAGIRAKAIANMSAPSSSALAIAQDGESTGGDSAATTTVAPSTSTQGVDSSTAAAPDSVDTAASPTVTPPTTETQSTGGTDSAAGSTQPTGDGAAPAGAGEAPPATTGTAVPGQQSSGGATSTGTGG